MFDDEVEKRIRVEVLLNAKTFGRPNPKAVAGKLLGKYADLRPLARDVNARVAELCTEILDLDPEQISNELSSLDPSAEQQQQKTKKEKTKKRIAQKKSLEELDGAVKGNFVVRYAPDPSKYPHIGQGMNYLINRLYADKYDGKVILRFDDTNPAIVRKKYYDAIREGILWLGCTWDEEIVASQHLQVFYDLTREWIESGHMYVCLCAGDTLSKMREEGIACEHRQQGSIDLFNQMLDGEFEVGKAIVRLVGDMGSENYVMRDPIMMRIVRDKHDLLDKFYPVFPTYDFESSYFDCKTGVTHIIRSGEFGTMRQELQSFIIKLLGGEPPVFKTFGRFNIQGCPTKGRVIRELVESKIVSGWDDIRLITLAGLMKRGIHPLTPRVLIQEAGLTPKNTNIAWVTLEKKSRELLEPNARRLFMVVDPVRLNITNPKPQKIELGMHPDKDMGKRVISVSDHVYISSSDANLKVGDEIRMKDLFNIRVLNDDMDVEITGSDVVTSMRKIQWVADDALPIKLQVPGLLEKRRGEIDEDSLSEISGLVEAKITDISEDEVIQFERLGFARVYNNNGKISGHIVHLI